MKSLILFLFLLLGTLTMASVYPSIEDLINQGGSSDDPSVNELWWNINEGIDTGDVVSYDPVPEPCTLILCGGGAIALFGFGRKK